MLWWDVLEAREGQLEMLWWDECHRRVVTWHCKSVEHVGHCWAAGMHTHFVHLHAVVVWYPASSYIHVQSVSWYRDIPPGHWQEKACFAALEANVAMLWPVYCASPLGGERDLSDCGYLHVAPADGRPDSRLNFQASQRAVGVDLLLQTPTSRWLYVCTLFNIYKRRLEQCGCVYIARL